VRFDLAGLKITARAFESVLIAIIIAYLGIGMLSPYLPELHPHPALGESGNNQAEVMELIRPADLE
jgi:hypothetical protein